MTQQNYTNSQRENGVDVAVGFGVVITCSCHYNTLIPTIQKK